MHTIEQAYNCILDTYPATVDNRRLLQYAMAGLVGYLVQQHQDQHNAVLPALTGNCQTDWQAFQKTYTTMTAHLSLSQQSLVGAAIKEMVNGLHDNHAHYIPFSNLNTRGSASQPNTQMGLGIVLPFDPDQLADAAPPLYMLSVDPGSPAEQAGLRPGDIIVTINGLPPFINQKPVSEIINQLSGSTSVQLQIKHPGAADTKNVRLIAAAYPTLPLVSKRLLSGNILYVRLTKFETGVADQIRRAVQEAGAAQLKGLILDLRGNGGGDVREQRRVISMFVHNQIIASFVDKQGQRTDQRTDDSLLLFHIRLVALIDRGCASACDATTMDIHDLHLGRLVGERTAGAVSGPSTDLFLDDGSVIGLPVAFMQGPAGEIVDGIGVPPDDEVHPTPEALAAGHDPFLEKALQDL
ncbi:S41 family peptidase [Ktedonobacter robiniae]|uniref:Peptidase S41 n=1 Tax=Ktedonobacter robiniae TaxID=2778365 RepID=A0ABQ3USQ5_9CHLR|nr:S41 family peptidase [Ktedonobacter robiniae]GHO55743.1 peptidase S41 [Ktedonobacter robiniae]